MQAQHSGTQVAQVIRPQQFAARPVSPEGRPRLEDGFIAIPNDVMDAIKGRLKGLHLLATLAVIEKTSRYRKDREDLSDSQIAQEWGCDRQRVGEAVSELIEAGVLLCFGAGRYGRILGLADVNGWGQVQQKASAIAAKSRRGKKPQLVQQKASITAAESLNSVSEKPHSTDISQKLLKTNTRHQPDSAVLEVAPVKPKAKVKPAGPAPLQVADLVADGLTEATADEFLALRRHKRAPLTPLAWKGMKAEFDKAALSAEQAVAYTVTRGWQSFEASWLRAAGPASAPAKVNQLPTDYGQGGRL